MIGWRCNGWMWVSQSHPDRPWEGEAAGGSGAAGTACPIGNPSNALTIDVAGRGKLDRQRFANQLSRGFEADTKGGTRKP